MGQHREACVVDMLLMAVKIHGEKQQKGGREEGWTDGKVYLDPWFEGTIRAGRQATAV